MYYGLFGKFTANAGKRDELLSILMQASELLKQNENCLHYLINTGDDENSIWVYETWTDKASHEASLAPAIIRALITTAMPLIASMSDQISLQVHGGKGI